MAFVKTNACVTQAIYSHILKYAIIALTVISQDKREGIKMYIVLIIYNVIYSYYS